MDMQVLNFIIKTTYAMIKTQLEKSYSCQENVKKQLEELCYSTLSISSVIDYFEKKQLTDEYARNWLDHLKGTAYDLDDLFDEIKTRTMTPSTPTVFDKTIMSKIDNISKSLERLYKVGDRLKSFVGESSNESSHTKHVPTTPIIAGDEVYGREEETKSVIKLLCDSNNDGADDISVIAIVGMCGIGKTILAKLVYNDTSVQRRFNARAWVDVSQEFDVVSVTKSIHEQIMGTTSSSKLLGTLQGDLSDKLTMKKFLIVLDNVSMKEIEVWESLRASLKTGPSGSRIIITSRDETVASRVGYGHVTHRMKLLTNNDCLKILTHHAKMTLKDSEAFSLAERCQGVPLAAKEIGCDLHSNESTKTKTTLERACDLAMAKYIRSVLLLIDHDLPTHLKMLFGYCSLFPKGYEFDKNDLVYLWMGEGFLENPPSSQSKEETGIEYFDELLLRSFFQHVSGSDTKFVMHHHMHELAKYVGGAIYCYLDEKMDVMQEYHLPPRHCSFLLEYKTFRKFEAVSNMIGLRSFIALTIESQRWSPSDVPNKILALVPKMQVLRVLSLSGYESITKLPNDICKLIHLRYLNLSSTGISTLPDSLGNLVNLEILLIRDCYSLIKLPASLGNLSHLRHLDNSGTNALKDMPISIGKLRKLQTLPKVVLGKGECFGFKEIGQLKLLSGTLAIHNLSCVNCTEKYGREACLKSKDKLDALILTWEIDHNETPESLVTEALRPHENLSTLTVTSYIGLQFPKWIGDASYSNLSSISIISCLYCTSLPPLGCLPKLKYLCIQNLPSIKNIGNEFLGSSMTPPFPKLEVLIFYNLPNWGKWGSYIGDKRCDIALPELRELSLTLCEMLEDISDLNFPRLRKLSLQHCHEILLRGLQVVDNLTILKIHAVPCLSDLSKKEIKPLVALEDLECTDCSGLYSLWNEGSRPPNLRRLEISNCPKLKSYNKPSQQSSSP